MLLLVIILLSSACIVENQPPAEKTFEINETSKNESFDPLKIVINESEIEAYELNLDLCLSEMNASYLLPERIANIPRALHPDYKVAILRVLNFSRRGVNVSERAFSVYGVKLNGQIRNFIEVVVEDYVGESDYKKEVENLLKDISAKGYKETELGHLKVLYKIGSSEHLRHRFYVLIPKGRRTIEVNMGRDIANEDAMKLLKSFLYHKCLNQ